MHDQMNRKKNECEYLFFGRFLLISVNRFVGDLFVIRFEVSHYEYIYLNKG